MDIFQTKQYEIPDPPFDGYSINEDAGRELPDPPEGAKPPESNENNNGDDNDGE